MEHFVGMWMLSCSCDIPSLTFHIIYVTPTTHFKYIYIVYICVYIYICQNHTFMMNLWRYDGNTHPWCRKKIQLQGFPLAHWVRTVSSIQECLLEGKQPPGIAAAGDTCTDPSWLKNMWNLHLKDYDPQSDWSNESGETLWDEATMEKAKGRAALVIGSGYRSASRGKRLVICILC